MPNFPSTKTDDKQRGHNHPSNNNNNNSIDLLTNET